MRITLSLSVFLSIHSSLLLTILNSKVVDAENTLKCLDSVDYNKDYFPDKVVPKFSKNWSITYHNTYKILTVKANNLNESEPTTESYLLYQCGTTPPESEVGKHKFSIQVPLQDELVLTETNQIPHIEQLGLRYVLPKIDIDDDEMSSHLYSNHSHLMHTFTIFYSFLCFNTFTLIIQFIDAGLNTGMNGTVQDTPIIISPHHVLTSYSKKM